jgi:DNA-binding response OmpR family regulator
VDKTISGQTGLDLAMTGNYDLLILDLMLPDLEGLEVCRRLRIEKVDIPIIMLTARSEEIDKVLGLESGADDYITKPFSVREFIARVKAVLRRTDRSGPSTQSGAEQEISFGSLTIDRQKRSVSLNGERIELTPKEYDLLLLLASNPGRSYTREQLLNTIWGSQFEGYEHTVNSHINRLRAKIETDANEANYILTTWGVGYRFNDNF